MEAIKADVEVRKAIFWDDVEAKNRQDVDGPSGRGCSTGSRLPLGDQETFARPRMPFSGGFATRTRQLNGRSLSDERRNAEVPERIAQTTPWQPTRPLLGFARHGDADQERGANPRRSRHCDRGVSLRGAHDARRNKRPPAPVREGRRRSGDPGARRLGRRHWATGPRSPRKAHACSIQGSRGGRVALPAGFSAVALSNFLCSWRVRCW